jgi:hypothetical protein
LNIQGPLFRASVFPDRGLRISSTSEFENVQHAARPS